VIRDASETVSARSLGAASDRGSVGTYGPIVPISRSHRRRLRREERRRRIEEQLRRRPTLIIERFPVSILLAVQYGAMLVFPAIVHHTQPEHLMLTVCGVGIGIAFVIEIMMARIPPGNRERPRAGVTPRSAAVIWMIGIVAQTGVVLIGKVSFGTQLSGGSHSHLTSLFTPLSTWLYFGPVMFLWLWRQGRVTRAAVWVVLGLSESWQLLLALRTAVTYEVATFALAMTCIAVLVRFIRLRWVVLSIALIPVLWPPLYHLRNDTRQSQTAAYPISGEAPASQRLREDLNFAHILDLPEVPDSSIRPSLLTEVRFGLLPRFIDSGRSDLQTAKVLSAAEGGNGNSAATLTTLGDAYALQGWWGVALLVASLTLAMGIAVRRRSPWGYMLASILVFSGIWIESTYPDCLAAVLQASVSLVVMAIAITILRLNRTEPWSPALASGWAAYGPRTVVKDAQSPRRLGVSRPIDLELSDLWDEAPGATPVAIPSDLPIAATPLAPKSHLSRTITKASIASVAANAASAFGGLLAARYLGPAVRGQYAAVMAWFGGALVLGEIGQQSAIVYYVARNPSRARDYVATSRTIMVLSGAVMAVAGLALAPILSHGHAGQTLAYRAVFICSPLIFVGASYLFALQARNIHRWIVIRAVQPTVYLLMMTGLIVLQRLTLDTAVLVAVTSFIVQAIASRHFCGSEGLLRGRFRGSLSREVLRYGTSQLLASTPATVNTSLDQMFLSQTVSSSALGQYSLAASLTALANPLLAPIGSVLFPRLASGQDQSNSARRMQRVAVLTTLGLGAILMGALAAVALPLIPVVFGQGYRPAIDLVWIMAPAGVFLGLNQVIGDLLRGRGQPLAVAVAQGSGACLTVAMLVVLVPILGTAGAAITTTVVYALTTVMMLFALRRHRGPGATDLVMAGEPQPEHR
jgi:O-antigen/teichoic acid export membrane protein